MTHRQTRAGVSDDFLSTAFVVSHPFPYLSVVVPAKNESKRLPKTLALLREALKTKKVAYELIVVDDGSIDDTAQIATALGAVVVRHSHSRGIAASIRTGSSKAVGAYVMTCPADVEDFEFLDEALKGTTSFDIVSVSKRHPDSLVIGYGTWRWFLSDSYHTLVKTLLGVPDQLTDTHYVKLFRTEKLLPVIPLCSIDGPVGETELIMRLVKNSATWTEVPAKIVHNGNHSKTSLVLVAKSAYEIGLLWCRELRNRKAVETRAP